MCAFALLLASLSQPTSSSSCSSVWPGFRLLALVLHWCINLSNTPPPPCVSVPPQYDYLPPKKVVVHSILLFYVPGKFSPASPFSCLNSLFTPSLSLSLTPSPLPPSLPPSPSLSLPFPEPFPCPPTPSTLLLLLHFLPVNLPSVPPSFPPISLCV